MSYSRFIDGVEALCDDSDWTPITPSQLLAKLEMHGKPKDQQRDAVARWLETNEATRFLQASLEHDGLVDPPSVDASHHSAA